MKRAKAHPNGYVRGGLFIAPEVGLPPGYDPPSAALAAPASKPPMSSLPPAAAETADRQSYIPPRYRLDPRWHWVDVTPNPWSEPVFVKGACKHMETVPVDLLLTGETVARLCLTCDTRLPVPGWP